jgi:Ulp1 family protease
MPVNLEVEHHWSLAIFVNVNGSLTKGEHCALDVDGGKSCILYLDSALRIKPNILKALLKVGNLIRTFLKRGEQAHIPWYQQRLRVPRQQNDFDCGLYVIEYVARFLSKPESLIGMLGARGTVLYPDDHYLEEILLKSREFKDVKLLKEVLSSIFSGINLDEALETVKQLY